MWLLFHLQAQVGLHMLSGLPRAARRPRFWWRQSGKQNCVVITAVVANLLFGMLYVASA
jgi:hypothetical protein